MENFSQGCHWNSHLRLLNKEKHRLLEVGPCDPYVWTKSRVAPRVQSLGPGWGSRLGLGRTGSDGTEATGKGIIPQDRYLLVIVLLFCLLHNTTIWDHLVHCTLTCLLSVLLIQTHARVYHTHTLELWVSLEHSFEDVIWLD